MQEGEGHRCDSACVEILPIWRVRVRSESVRVMRELQGSGVRVQFSLVHLSLPNTKPDPWFRLRNCRMPNQT